MLKIVKPTSIRIEASSLCQLRCPCCPQTQGLINQPYIPGQNKKVLIEEDDFLNPWYMNSTISRPNPIGLGYLKFHNFKNIIDQNSWIKHIELSNWGEMFLNPQLVSIIEYAYKKR